MKVWAGITGEGITLRIGDAEQLHLEACTTAHQTEPRGCYVYGHFDEKGIPFYIGKGTGRRAWKDSRHSLWHRYVTHHLAGKYHVRILEDNLSSEQAEELEGAWIAQEKETLVNWINFGRQTDYSALEKYHALRNANRELIALARSLEKTDPERAISTYQSAIAKIAAYATMKTEDGLIGRLLDEERQELGYSGELEALDRLTLCLTRLRRGGEARSVAESYFAQFRADLALRSADSIRKRIVKAVSDVANNSFESDALKTTRASS